MHTHTHTAGAFSDPLRSHLQSLHRTFAPHLWNQDGPGSPGSFASLLLPSFPPSNDPQCQKHLQDSLQLIRYKPPSSVASRNWASVAMVISKWQPGIHDVSFCRVLSEPPWLGGLVIVGTRPDNSTMLQKGTGSLPLFDPNLKQFHVQQACSCGQRSASVSTVTV